MVLGKFYKEKDTRIGILNGIKDYKGLKKKPHLHQPKQNNENKGKQYKKYYRHYSLHPSGVPTDYNNKLILNN